MSGVYAYGSSGEEVKISSSNTQLDPELLYEDNYINVALDTFFNDEEKFGIIFEDEESYINLYANYCPDTDVLEMYYIIHSDDKVSDEIAYVPDETEKSEIVQMIEQLTQQQDSMSLSESWSKFKADMEMEM